MIIRIVKLTMRKEEVDTFKAYFSSVCETIRNQEGCTLLQAWQDINQPEIFFTYSYWETEADLENYRQSALFDEVWTFTKQLFNDKPEAWSVDKIVSLK